MTASRRSAPHKDDDAKSKETISILKSELRRLQKRLKEAQKNECSCGADPDEPLPRPQPHAQGAQPPPSHIICDCSAEVREVDLYSHILYICTKCAAHKSVSKRM